jgi:hypothetical protein
MWSIQHRDRRRKQEQKGEEFGGAAKDRSKKDEKEDFVRMDEEEEEEGEEEAEEDSKESSHSEEETEKDEIIKTKAGEEVTVTMVGKEKPWVSHVKQGRKRKQRSADGRTEVEAKAEEEEWDAPPRRLCIDLDALRKAHARDAPVFLDEGLPSPWLVGLVEAQWTSRKGVDSEVCRDSLCTPPFNSIPTSPQPLPPLT